MPNKYIQSSHTSQKHFYLNTNVIKCTNSLNIHNFNAGQTILFTMEMK